MAWARPDAALQAQVAPEPLADQRSTDRIRLRGLPDSVFEAACTRVVGRCILLQAEPCLALHALEGLQEIR